MDLRKNKEKLVKFLSNKPETYKKNWSELAEMFDLPTAEIARHTWRKNKNHSDTVMGNIMASETATGRKEGITNFTEDIKTGKAEMTLQSTTEIKSLEDLSKFIDTERWQVTKYVQNSWSGRFGVKAWLEPKKNSESDVMQKIVKNYKSDWKKIDDKYLKINTTWDTESMAVINLNDLHFDKLDLTQNTIDERVDDYFKCLNGLILKAYHSAKIEEIVFVIGNDMFNTDTIHNTTTNGTPQNVSVTWDVAYEKVFDAMVKSVYMLKNFCKKLNVILVQGNHDRTKSYYLAHAVEQHFKGDKSIKFDRTSNNKKVYVYGNTFLGFNHGNNINDKLPLAFATEFYNEWGKCKYHDIIISDKHHNNEKTFKSNQTQNEYQGVKLRILPSLTGTDKWHNDNLYHSRQSGIALVYDKQFGKSSEFEYQL